MATLFHFGDADQTIFVCEKISIVSGISQEQNENGYYFEIYTDGRNQPFIAKSPYKEQCQKWRDALLEMIMRGKEGTCGEQK